MRDKRRIDPRSGEVRAEAAAAAASARTGGAGGVGAAGGPAPAGGPGPGAAAEGELAALRAQVQERTTDLQRLKAEYDNYRRRVERDRQLVAEQAVGRVLAAMLPTLDDIGRARDHGDLEGPFKAVAESLESTLESLGLERFGAVGDPFDPLVHEALMHSYRSDVTAPTCVQVFRSGYSYGGRVLRPAQVAVAEPEEPAEEPAEQASGAPAAAEPGAEASAQGPAAGAAEAGASPGDTGGGPGLGGGPNTGA
ncbi:MAG: nucleotide exchange factor GrpE [Frankia sp.]|nr:nucleotide exchange factor GrpE [Frankia sp.]